MSQKIRVRGKLLDGAALEKKLIQGEHNATVIEFTLDRYVDGIDLSKAAFAINGENVRGQAALSALVKAAIVEDTFTLTWTVSSNFTAEDGPLLIWINGSTSQNGKVTMNWQTAPARVMVEKGFLIGNYIDLAEQLLQDIAGMLARAEEAAGKAERSAKAAAESADMAGISAGKADESAKAAKASETAAANSEKNAKDSATKAAVSEKNADASAKAAKASETAAATSASNAKASENAAKQSATNAANSATASANSAAASAASAQQAKEEANRAGGSAADASLSAAQAKESAQKAKASEENAADSAKDAENSAGRASKSQGEAAKSAEAAKDSKNAAKQSETAAAGSARNAADSANASASSAAEAQAIKDSTEIFHDIQNYKVGFRRADEPNFSYTDDLRGPRGESGIYITTNSLFRLYINEEGELVVVHADETPPDLRINEDGYLVWVS